jgi:hypothetical protein
VKIRILFGAVLILCGKLGAEPVNIAPEALAVPPVAVNPINGGKPLVFSARATFSDEDESTALELPGAQPSRLEFHFPGTPAFPRRCEIVCRTQDLRKGHIEILQDGKWTRVGDLPAGEKPALDWPPVPVSAVAVVIEDVTNTSHSPAGIAEVRLLSDKPWKKPEAPPTLALSARAPDNVFLLGEAIQVDCTIQGTASSEARIEWQWEDFLLEPLDPGGKAQPPAGTPLTISYQPAEQGPCMLKVRLVEKSGAVAAESWLLVGTRDPGFPEKVPPLPSGGKLLELPDFFWGADIYIRMLRPQFSAKDMDFGIFKQAGFNIVGAFQNMPWFEPLPGVYNFKTLDRIVRKAEDAGILLELGLWRWDLTGPLQHWLVPKLARGRDPAVTGREPSLASEEYRQSILDASEVFVRRYRDSSAVAMWHVQPYGYVDHPISPTMLNGEARLDYSEFVQTAYRKFLRKKYKTIAALNNTYGTSYGGFAEIGIPQSLARGTPNVAEGTLILDNRPVWRDYLFFRDHVMVLGLQENIYQLIRGCD